MLRLTSRLTSRLRFSHARVCFRRRFFNTALLTRLAFDMVKTNGSMKSLTFDVGWPPVPEIAKKWSI